jgi:hypothetical protein
VIIAKQRFFFEYNISLKLCYFVFGDVVCLLWGRNWIFKSYFALFHVYLLIYLTMLPQMQELHSLQLSVKWFWKKNKTGSVCNNEGRPCNHCGRGKTYLYYECLLVALGIQHAVLMLQIVVCDLSGCTIYFPRYITNGTIVEKEILNIKCVFWFSPQLNVWDVSHSKKNWVRYDQKCILVFIWSTPYFC